MLNEFGNHNCADRHIEVIIKKDLVIIIAPK